MKPEDMLGGAPVGKPYIRTRDVFQTDNDNGVEGYSDEALALVADTEKTGVPEGVNAVGMAGSAKHGTIAVQLFARVNPETHVIEQAGYRAHGCLAMIASACAAVYWMEGKTVTSLFARVSRLRICSLDRMPATTHRSIACCARTARCETPWSIWRSHRVFARQKRRNHHGDASENNGNRKSARVFGQCRYYVRVRYGV